MKAAIFSLSAFALIVSYLIRRPKNLSAWLLLTVFATTTPGILYLSLFRDPVYDTEYLKKRNKKRRKDYHDVEYCVIGAGFGGLGMMAALKRAKIPFKCFESDDNVGGNWYHGVYENVNIISSRLTTEFKDYPMPKHYPDFPSAKQMRTYLRDYAEHWELLEHIQFNTKVEKVEPIGGPDQTWRVITTDGSEKIFGGVIVANGHHWDKRWGGPYDNPEKFEGEQIHSKDYFLPEQLENKDVLVIGCGNSACDIAVEAGRFAKSSAISIRNGTYFIPRTLCGTPAIDFIKPWMPLWFQRFFISLWLKIAVGDMELYGMEKPKYKIWERHPTINSELLNSVKLGKIKPYKDIKRFLGGRRVEFVDGAVEEFDMVIHATGYHVSVPILKEGVVKWAENTRHYHKDGRKYPDLRAGASLRYKNIYVVGIGQPRYGAGPLITLGSELTATLIETQPKLKYPIGAVLKKLGAPPIRDYLMDPHSIFTQGASAIGLLEWLPFLEQKILFRSGGPADYSEEYCD